MAGRVVAVAKDNDHRLSKRRVASIPIPAGLGAKDDVHQGVTVKHRSRVAPDPTQLNLRQVYLLQAELIAELHAKGFEVGPTDLGENITSEGLDLLGLPGFTVLRIGAAVMLDVTGVRNPYEQLGRFQPGLLAAVVDRGSHSKSIRKAGIMAVARRRGEVRSGDQISVELPPPPCLA